MTFYDEHGNVAMCGCGQPAVSVGLVPPYQRQSYCAEHTPWQMPGQAEQRDNERLRADNERLRAREAALVEMLQKLIRDADATYVDVHPLASPAAADSDDPKG